MFQPASDTFAAAVDLLLRPFYSLLFLCSLSASKGVREKTHVAVRPHRRPRAPSGLPRPSQRPYQSPLSCSGPCCLAPWPPPGSGPQSFLIYSRWAVSCIALHPTNLPAQSPPNIHQHKRNPPPPDPACVRHVLVAWFRQVSPVRAALASSGPSLLVFVMPHHHRQPLLVDDHGQFASPSIACCPCCAYVQ